MHLVDKSIEDRNSLFSLLQHIEKIVHESPNSQIKNHIMSLLHDIPIDFQ
jgi:hypothetical protein